VQGKLARLVYNSASSQYVSVTAGGGSFSHAQLANLIAAGDTLTVTGIPRGSAGIYASPSRPL